MRAFYVDETSGEIQTEVSDGPSPTPDVGEVRISVHYSGVNYKDALVAQPQSRVRRRDRLVAGVDASGVVVEDTSGTFAVGTAVVVHGGDVGVARDGGFATELVAPLGLVTPLPAALSPRVAMIVGTAGFTAMQSILALEDAGLRAPGSVLVSGATGGVGSAAVAYLAQRGYEPVAVTGSPENTPWLLELGATTVLGRDEISVAPQRVLDPERFDGAVDCVGGDTLHQILRALKYGASVAASGLVASAELSTTVYPFITRGVNLLGIDSVMAPAETRVRVWDAIAQLVSALDFDRFVDQEISLDEIAEVLPVVLRGRSRGRYLVDVRRSAKQ